MNIQASLLKTYNVIKKNQIADEDIKPENAAKAFYMSGMLHSAKLFMNLYNGDISDTTLEYELSQLQQEAVN